MTLPLNMANDSPHTSKSNSLTHLPAEIDDRSESRPQRIRRRYSSEFLYNIQKNPICQERPLYLDLEFCDEKGVWDPHKWHASFTGTAIDANSAAVKPNNAAGAAGSETQDQHGQSPSNNADKPKAAEDSRLGRLQQEDSIDIVLSPQRRSFGSGCKVNEVLQDKNDKIDMSNPKRSAGFLSNRRSFTTTNNLNARKTRTGWNSEPNETYIASGRNERSSTTQYVSKSSGYNRFMTKEPLDSLPMGHHSEFGSNLATRRFESKKLKNDREFASSTFVSNTSAPPPFAATTQNDVISNTHRTFENSANSSHGEYMDDYDTMIPSSPYGSEVIDENMWLDVVPGAEFEFNTDLEASKVDYNNEIDDLNAEQLESDLTVLERVTDDDSNRNVNNADDSGNSEPQREDAPIAEDNHNKKFDLDEFFSKQLPMKQTESSAFPERGGIGQSRLQRLFKANDEHKQMGAEFDRYLQSFEFDPETNDLHRFTEPNSNRPDMPTNAMNLMSEKTFLPVNAPVSQQSHTTQQPQPTQRSRFAHIFNSDFNQNNISKISLEQNKMGPLAIKPIVDSGASVFSVSDLEADISPVATTNNSSFAKTIVNHSQQQGISRPFDIRLARERKTVISANELERDIVASTSPDNDLSAFTSLLDKMGAQKAQSAMNSNSSQSNNRPQMFTNNTVPRIYSPGPDIMQTSVGMEAHFMNERNQDINAKKMPSGARPESFRAEPVNHRNMLFSQVAKQNGDGTSVNKTQQSPIVSGISGIDPRNISPIPTPMGQNMNVNTLMQNLQQQKAALNNIPSSGATPQNLLNLPPNLILFQQQLALQQQQQKLKQQQQQNKPVGIPSNVTASNASKRQPGNQEMFTPTAVMRNLSLTENPINPFSSGSISSASSQTFSNSSQKSMNSIVNQQPFNGNALQTNQLLLQSALMNNLKVGGGSTTSTQALRTQISAGIQGVPSVVNAVSSANQSNTKMASSAGQPSDINHMTSSSGASTQGGNSNSVSNVTPVIGAPIINPFLFNPLMRAPPSLVLPTPNNSLNNVQQLQQMLFRQQFANNVLLRAQLMRQLNANVAGAAAIPNNNSNNNNNLPVTGAPNVGSGVTRNPNVSPQTLPLSTATIDALLASGDSLFSTSVNGPANTSLNATNLSASQLNKTVGAPAQVQDMQKMKLPPGLNVKDNMGPS